MDMFQVCFFGNDNQLKSAAFAGCLNDFFEQKSGLPVQQLFFDEENKTTVVWWEDGTKTSVTCREGDVFNEEVGLVMAFFKRFSPDWSHYGDILSTAAHAKPAKEKSKKK